MLVFVFSCATKSTVAGNASLLPVSSRCVCVLITIVTGLSVYLPDVRQDVRTVAGQLGVDEDHAVARLRHADIAACEGGTGSRAGDDIEVVLDLRRIRKRRRRHLLLGDSDGRSAEHHQRARGHSLVSRRPPSNRAVAVMGDDLRGPDVCASQKRLTTVRKRGPSAPVRGAAESRIEGRTVRPALRRDRWYSSVVKRRGTPPH